MQRDLIVILICFSLMTEDVERVFMCIWATHIFSYEVLIKLFKSSYRFKIDFKI